MCTLQVWQVGKATDAEADEGYDTAHDGPVWAVAVNVQLRLIATAGHDCAIRIW